jgi:Fe-S cluster biogenesis protein NfuA/nitrite reductase/ring-hydroxylating ferredoxin subunit
MAAEPSDAAELVGRAEALLERLETVPDPALREQCTATAAALLDLYGEGLTRMVALIVERDDGSLADAFAGDELISHLLLLHGLHPLPLEERLQSALDEVRPYLESHGGNVEVLSADDGVVRLRLEGSCSGCPSSAVTLKLAIEEAIQRAAPDVAEIVAEGVTEAAPQSGPTLLQIDVPASMQQSAGPGWAMAGGLPDVPDGALLVKAVGGENLLFLRLGNNVYAYRPECAACRESLAGAKLIGTTLECASCSSQYDVLRAGRCLDSPQLHLEPVPLLVDESGLVKVALGVAT